MKIVVDTNVLISAAFRDGLPEKVILWLLVHPEWEWIASDEIIREYKIDIYPNILKISQFNQLVINL